jgi:hypothetical protein
MKLSFLTNTYCMAKSKAPGPSFCQQHLWLWRAFQRGYTAELSVARMTNSTQKAGYQIEKWQ